MNKIQSRLRLLTAVFAGAAMLLLSGAGMADPPARVARLSFFSGPVSFSPAGEDEWVLATPNRPLITGDRLWADAGGRAELQAGSIALRLGATTNVNVLNLDDRATQLELTQGSLYVRVWRIDRGETVEIDTPNLAFTVNSVGRYRIDVLHQLEPLVVIVASKPHALSDDLLGLLVVARLGTRNHHQGGSRCDPRACHRG